MPRFGVPVQHKKSRVGVRDQMVTDCPYIRGRHGFDAGNLPESLIERQRQLLLAPIGVRGHGLCRSCNWEGDDAHGNDDRAEMPTETLTFTPSRVRGGDET